jgi:hypothetical protein
VNSLVRTDRHTGPGDTLAAGIVGDPDGLTVLVSRLSEAGEILRLTGARMAAVSSGAWAGRGQSAFHVSTAEQGNRCREAASSFLRAAAAIARFLAALRSAQATARAILQRSPASAAEVAAVLALLDIASATAASELTAAATCAPRHSSQPRSPRLPNTSTGWWHSVAAGAAESLWSSVVTAGRFSGSRALIDPHGWDRDMRDLASNLISDPRHLPAQLLDWETWRTDPARALGHLLPDMALALDTGGLGLAAREGVSLVSREGAGQLLRAAHRVAGPVPQGTRLAIHAAAADPATLTSLFSRWYSPVHDVNAARFHTGAPGAELNCVYCVVATDSTLGGAAAAAMPSAGPQGLSVLERIYEHQFMPSPSYDSIVETMTAAGPGSRGIVAGLRTSGPGHVFNVINDAHGVVFIDGQVGGFAILEDFDELELLITQR